MKNKYKTINIIFKLIFSRSIKMSGDLHFSSISKFVDFINSINTDINKAFLYFEGNIVFKNMYEKHCIKPIFIELINKNNESIFMPHKEIIEKFDGQLVIAYNESNRRKIEEAKKENLYRMVIYFKPKTFSGNTYYNSIIQEVTNEKNKEHIRKQVVEIAEEVENDIPDQIFEADLDIA